MGKCLGKGTRVLLHNGTSQKVEDIQNGDLLMGDDSRPRTVLSVASGIEPMYWIRQENGIDYRVNESHILCLLEIDKNNPEATPKVLEISVKDYLALSPQAKNSLYGYKTAIELNAQPLRCDPYLLGLFVGGNMFESNTGAYAGMQGERKLPSNVPKISTKTTPSHTSHDATQVQEIPGTSTFNGNGIPAQYLLNSRKNRLALLAGLIDACPAGNTSNTCQMVLKNTSALPQIKWLCNSLGFRVKVQAENIPSFYPGFTKLAYLLRIEGALDEIPVKTSVFPTSAAPNPLLVSTIQVVPDGIDIYYGFEIDGNGRFLLEDLTVTHNTSLILAMALNAAKDFNKGVALFSLEMANTQLVSRLISMEAEIPGSKMRSGKLEDYEWQQLQSTVEKLSQIPVFIDDTPGINIFELRAKCRRLKMQHDIQLIIIDYLQLMTGASENNRNANREQEIAGISRALKGMAKELSVPVIALSQLSRAVEVRGGAKRPQLSDLRESGSIEQDADIVGFIYRPEYYGILEDETGQSLKGIAEVIIAKHRHGALDSVKLKFTDTFAKFGNLDDPSFAGLADPLTGPFQPSVITRQSRMNDEDIPF
jgi:replicative DNA helicase